MAGSFLARKAATAGSGLLLGLACLIASGAVKGDVDAMPTAKPSSENLIETSFTDIQGWASDDQGKALKALLRFCAPPQQRFSAALCQYAQRISSNDSQAARAFFETWFTPYRFKTQGFVTGYFEPELSASRTKSAAYPAPLLKAPEGLEKVSDKNRPAGWPEDLSHGRRTAKGLEPLPDRGEIMDGALADENLELVWLSNPVDAFFVHVQGSARLRLDDGSTMRVGYAGKTGYPYTSIARVLVERGEGTPEELTMSGLKRWLLEHPDQVDALLRRNRSYIFFREIEIKNPEDGPVGGAGLPLVAGRSLAVDPSQIPYGAPVFVSTNAPGLAKGTEGLQRLMIADDTGSAIRGPARGDIFVGSGDESGRIAGEIRHKADMIVLLPKEAAR